MHLVTKSLPARRSQPARPVGRPAIGKPLPVRLSDDERMTSELLGNGIAAEGVRIALRAARKMGEEKARELGLDQDSTDLSV